MLPTTIALVSEAMPDDSSTDAARVLGGPTVFVLISCARIWPCEEERRTKPDSPLAPEAWVEMSDVELRMCPVFPRVTRWTLPPLVPLVSMEPKPILPVVLE